MKRLIAMLIVVGFLATTSLGCGGGDTKKTGTGTGTGTGKMTEKTEKKATP